MERSQRTGTMGGRESRAHGGTAPVLKYQAQVVLTTVTILGKNKDSPVFTKSQLGGAGRGKEAQQWHRAIGAGLPPPAPEAATLEPPSNTTQTAAGTRTPLPPLAHGAAVVIRRTLAYGSNLTPTLGLN